QEFLRKFILAPLDNNQPLIGAAWSVTPGDPQARGFGKSTLMGEESKLINRDFGKTALLSLNVSEEDASENPVLAGYASFNVKAGGDAGGGISSIDTIAFNLARFVLLADHESGRTVHECLQETAAARLIKSGEAEEGQERD